MWVVWDVTSLPPNHYFSSYLSWLFDTCTHTFMPTKRFSLSSSLSLFFVPKSADLWPSFTQLWHYSLKCLFYSFCCSINHLICGCILHSYCILPWGNWDWCSFSLLYSLLILCILFLFLIYYFHQAQYFRAKTFLSRDLYRSSWYMLILQETRSGLKSLGKLSNTRTLIPYSCFSYFSLIFLNFNLILYISLKQMSVFLLLP